MIKKSINYSGKIFFNKKYPDGVKKEKLTQLELGKWGGN